MYTIVTGLLDINRGKWSTYYKRSFSDYLEHMSKVVLRIDAPMVIFAEEEHIPAIRELRKDYPQTLIIPTRLNNTRLYKHKDVIEKIQGTSEYQNDVQPKDKDCPEYCEPLYNIVVNNKAEWVRQAALLDPYGTEYFVWLDAGFGHGKFTLRHHSKLDIAAMAALLDPGQVFCLSLADAMVATDYHSYFKANQDFAVGQLLIMSKSTVEGFCSDYYGVVQEALSRQITDDDQYHLAMVSAEHKDRIVFFNVKSWSECSSFLTENIVTNGLRVAVLVCGNMRSWHECGNKEWMKNYDKFGSTYTRKYNFHPFIQQELGISDDINNNTLIDPREELKGFLDVVINDNDRDLKIESTFHPDMKEIYHGYYQYRSILGGLLAIRRYEKLRGFKYDVIVKTRFDMNYSREITEDDLREAESNILITTKGVYPPDILVISSRDTIFELAQYGLRQYSNPESPLSWQKPPHGILDNFAKGKFVSKDFGDIKRPSPGDYLKNVKPRIAEEAAKIKDDLDDSDDEDNEEKDDEGDSDDEKGDLKIVAFHQRQLCARGTTVALYDYACANEDVSGNLSVILTLKNNDKHDQNVIKKFQSRFPVLFYDHFNDVDALIEKFNITHMYAIKAGYNDGDITSKIPTIVHAVFECYSPHGIYCFVSKHLADKYNKPWLPHIVNPLPKGNDDLRKELRIPDNAYVYGRYGGRDTFSIGYAHEAIREVVDELPEVYFLFCNTDKFIDHPRCIFLDTIVENTEKGRFIRTCDAMIHARADGETFGLAVAEFALAQRMVLTCKGTRSDDNEHIRHLGDRALIYRNKEELKGLIASYPHIPPVTPIPYERYTPEYVMDIFWSLFKN